VPPPWVSAGIAVIVYVVQKRFAHQAVGFVRARLLGSTDRARPFGLEPAPDHFFNPFGTPPR
jgi:hypothetical protein